MIMQDITEILNDFAPEEITESWDNTGFLLGDINDKVSKILLCLDVTEGVITESIENNVDLIISHHPFIFNSVKRITADDVLGNKILRLIKNNISVYSSHIPLDLTQGGTNDTLFEKLELINKGNFMIEEANGFSLGRTGYLKESLSLKDFSLKIKNAVGVPYLNVVGDLEKKINKVALCTGSAGRFKYMQTAIKENCDIYITSDIDHHDALDGSELGLCLVDATHYGTEFMVTETLKNLLESKVDESVEIIIATKNEPIFKTL